ncbi:MAG: cytochrome P450 [Acidimicrobiales bacterium]
MPSSADHVDAAARSANPFDPSVAADPVPFYRALRDDAPVALLMGMPGTHVLSRYDDVRFALQHPEIFSSEVRTLDIGQERPLIPMQVDPPDHVKYRRVIDPHLAPREVAPRAEGIRWLVNHLIDGFIERGRCDLHAELSVPFPATVFLDLCGMPQEDVDTYLGWKDDIVRPQLRHPELAGDRAALTATRHRAGAEMYDFFSGLIADRRASPGDDVFSRFLAGTVDGEAMTDEQLLDIGYLFILGGLDTVTSTLDCSLAHLARDPELRARLAADPSAIPVVVEEMLRLHTPLMQVLRVVKEPVELAGVAMAPGDHVMVMLGAADTDPAEFGATAGEVDLDRTSNRHVAFGAGPHRCLGSHLARVELRIAFEEVFRRLPDFELDESPAEPLELVYSPGIREVAALPVRFTPGPVEGTVG